MKLENMGAKLNRRYDGKGPAERRLEAEQVLLLRNQGVSMFEISQRLQIPESTAYTRLDMALKARIDPAVDEYRKQQDSELDRQYMRHEQAVLRYEDIINANESNQAVVMGALAGREKSIQAQLRVMERKARLYGLDAPVKVEATAPAVTEQDLDLTEMLAKAKEAATAREQALRGETA